MDDLLDDAVLDAAPRFGLNARALILQAALAQCPDDQEGGQCAAAEEFKRAEVEAQRQGAAFLEAVDARERPQVAYNPRAKFARIIRQTVLNKLAGQHLALAGHHAGQLPPGAVSFDCELRRAAFATALAQESELYGRCATGQSYQNKAARTQALDWGQPQYAVQQPPAQPSLPVGAVGSRAAEGRERPPPAKRRKSRPAPRQLVEVDLDWEAAVPEADEEEEEEEGQLGGAIGEGHAAEGRTVPAKPQAPVQREEQLHQLKAGGTQSAVSSSQQPQPQQPEQQELQEPSKGPPAGLTHVAAPPLAEALDTVPAGTAPAATVAAYTPSEVAAASAGGVNLATVREADTVAGLDKGDGSGGSGEGGAAAKEDVRQAVLLFIRAELEPLRRRGKVSEGVYSAVVGKACDKVLARHPGAPSADFLVREAEGVRRLVAQYVQHCQARECAGQAPAGT